LNRFCMPLVCFSVPSSTPLILIFGLLITSQSCCGHDYLFFLLSLSECSNSSILSSVHYIFLLLDLVCIWCFLQSFNLTIELFILKFPFISRILISLLNFLSKVLDFSSKSWTDFLTSFTCSFESLLNSLTFQPFPYLWIWFLRSYEILEESYWLAFS
jgi:hypothetical protein